MRRSLSNRLKTGQHVLVGRGGGWRIRRAHCFSLPEHPSHSFVLLIVVIRNCPHLVVFINLAMTGPVQISLNALLGRVDYRAVRADLAPEVPLVPVQLIKRVRRRLLHW